MPEDDGGDAQFAIYTPNQIYIFSLYWILEVLSTVGYGDYAGAGTEEFLFTIFLEFCGITFFALLTGLIPELVEPEKDFNKLILDKTYKIDYWIIKLNQASYSLSYHKFYMPANLYLPSINCVEEAFERDHNMIIEQFGFY